MFVLFLSFCLLKNFLTTINVKFNNVNFSDLTERNFALIQTIYNYKFKSEKFLK